LKPLPEELRASFGGRSENDGRSTSLRPVDVSRSSWLVKGVVMTDRLSASLIVSFKWFPRSIMCYALPLVIRRTVDMAVGGNR